MPSPGGFGFGPFHLDVRAKQLTKTGEPIALSARQFDLLLAFVTHAGEILTKNHLMQVGWPDVVVTENNLVKIIKELRRVLDPTDPESHIRTVARVGYRFVVPVTREDARQTDAELDALLAPHRAWLDGRAALETLGRDAIEHARATFEQLLVHHPADANMHVGLANACVLQYEATRADLMPDTDALAKALAHALEARRLNPSSGETWVTLGFVLERVGARRDDHLNAQAAFRHGVSLDPQNWRHQFRLAMGTWGEERMIAVRHTLALMPDAPLARLLAATVWVARGVLDEAERQVDAALAALPADSAGRPRFPIVALHWLKGLLLLARGAEEEALASFARELALETRGQLYARECCANTWYAIGVCHLRRGDDLAARAAFDEAIARVPRHPMAHVGLALVAASGAGEATVRDDAMTVARVAASKDAATSMDAALALAACLVAGSDVDGAVQVVAAALAVAPPGNAGWLLPIEPLLGVQRNSSVWTSVLATLRSRAA